MRNKLFGAIGENLAVAYLQTKDYEIIENNFSNKIGEIDIIALDGERVVFIEVKYRNSERFGLPREAVNYFKQQKIKNVALAYLKSRKWLDKPCRFDVIEVLDKKVVHIENCF